MAKSIKFLIVGLIAIFLFADCTVTFYDDSPPGTGLLEGVIPPLPSAEEVSEYLNRDEFYEAEKQRAFEQAEAQDYTNLEEPVTWKFLWVRCNNVEYDGVMYSLTDENKQQFEETAERFKLLLEEAFCGNMIVEYEVKDIDKVIAAEKLPENTRFSHDYGDVSHVIVPQHVVTGELGGISMYGKYDSIMCMSAIPEDLVNAAGIETHGVDTGLCYAHLTSYSDDEVYHMSPNFRELVAIHEFIHQLEGFEFIIGVPEIPNVDEAEKFNYHEDTELEWWPFYMDILQGKVLFEGKYIGVFPQMLKFSPRNFFNRQGILYYPSKENEESESASWRTKE